MSENRVVIFLHVPKASGSTLNRIIAREFSAQEIWKVRAATHGRTTAELEALSAEVLKRIRVITGHALFGLHEFVRRPCTYVTLVRDPVERTLSHYYHALRSPEHSAHARLARGEMNLEDFARSVPNRQTRFIAGLDGADLRVLETAKTNIESHFAVVGLTERFDESLVLMRRALGWRLRSYRKTNVTANRPQRADIPAATLRVIEECNALDIALYELAAQLFKQRVRKQGAGFHAEVARLKLANTAARLWQFVRRK